MDYWILASSVGFFGLLLVSLPVVFRFVHAYDGTVWYIRLAVFFGCMVFLFWWASRQYSWITYGEPSDWVTCTAASLSLYSLLSVLFLFGVFGVFEASVTLHLLTKIALSGSTGIHPNALLVRYNRSSIVKRRIDRLLWSGELIVVGGRYRLSRRFSYFMAREYFLDALRYAFPRP